MTEPIIAYCDCFSGVSGDMLLGALVDAGLPLTTLHTELAGLGLGNSFELADETVWRGTMRATKVHVILHDDHNRRFSLNDLVTLIEGSQLSPRVQEQSISVFRRLTKAEGRVHATPVEAIRFHEKGVLDLIIDIVGTVIGLDGLGIDQSPFFDDHGPRCHP